MAVDPVAKRRILDEIARQGVVKSADLSDFIRQIIPENEITLDLARKAVATRYANSVKQMKDAIGRPVVRSLRRDDGWYVVSAGRYGPAEAQLTRTSQLARRESVERSIVTSDALIVAMQDNNCTLMEIPAEVWEHIMQNV